MKTTKNEKEEFIRVGTTLYKLVNQPRLNGGYVKKRIPWNNETLRQDYGKDYSVSEATCLNFRHILWQRNVL